MKCSKCDKEFPERRLDYHHLFPKEFGGSDKNGRILLCKKHHRELHILINNLSLKDKNSIVNLTNKWLLDKENKNYPLCPKCMNNRLAIRQVGSNYLILGCAICGFEIKNTDYYIDYISREIKDSLKSIKKEEIKDGGFPKI